MKLGLCFLTFAPSATVADKNSTGPATLHIVMSDDRHAGFKDKLKIYQGKNCRQDVLTGKICDYSYLQAVSHLDSNSKYDIELTKDIDCENDQLLMTYRSADEAIIKTMSLMVQLGEEKRTINLLNLRFGPGSNKNLAFDFDRHNHPCDSHYPRDTVCAWDQIFDLKTLTASRSSSLLTGTLDDTFDRLQPDVPPRIRADQNPNQLKLTTGHDRDDGSDYPLFVYYGKKCNKEICQYSKVASIHARQRNTEYSVWLPDFDPYNDQLLMDYRHADHVTVDKLTFDICTDLDGCQHYDLLKFGDEPRRRRVTFDYQSTEQPCHSIQYGDHDCIFDVVWNFKHMEKYVDQSLFTGNHDV